MTITVTEEELKAIVNQVFEDGENWGITHSTWFMPTEDDIKEVKEQSYNSVLKKIPEKNITH